MNEYRIETNTGNFTIDAEDSDMCALAAGKHAKENFILAQRAKMILLDADSGDLVLGEFDLTGAVLPKNWKEIKELVSETYQEARADAVKHWEYPVHRSRGAFIWFQDKDGQNVYQEAEHIEMPKTKTAYLALLAEVEAEYPDVQRAFVSVGMDSAASVYDMNNLEDYAPWTGESDNLIHVF